MRRSAKGVRNQVEALEAEVARLRSTGAVLSRRLYGRKSEQQKKPRSERKRGHRRGDGVAARADRHALSREFCRRTGWLKPDGGLKDMMARVTMLAMHRDGVIALLPPRGGALFPTASQRSISRRRASTTSPEPNARPDAISKWTTLPTKPWRSHELVLVHQADGFGTPHARDEENGSKEGKRNNTRNANTKCAKNSGRYRHPGTAAIRAKTGHRRNNHRLAKSERCQKLFGRLL